MTRPRWLFLSLRRVIAVWLSDRLRELRDAPRGVPAGVDQTLRIALRMLEDPEAAVGELRLIGRTERADRVAIAAATAAEAADRNTAAAPAATTAWCAAAGRGGVVVVGRVVVGR